MRAMILAGGMAAALVAATGSVAMAGTAGPTVSLGKSHGLEYMRGKYESVATQTAQPANCDGDAEVTGGGGTINGPAAGTALHETYPLEAGPSGWQSEASTTGSARRLTSFAVCGGVDVDYFSHQSSVGGPNTVSHGIQPCPSSEVKPIGGGMSATGPGIKLIASHAVLPPSTPGWAPSVWNNTMDDTLVDDYAICSDGFRVRYRTSERQKLRAGEAGVATAKCKSDEAVLAGGFVGRLDQVVGVRTVALGTKPWDSKADANKTPDDGWQARAQNAETFRVELEAQAVCMRGLAPTR